MKNFKIRASALGKIMGAPRNKGDKEKGNLSQTAKTYLETWLKEQLYEKRINFSSKYTDKGIEVEDLSIDFLSNIRNTFLAKNEKNFENDFMTGTPDIILKDKIIDIKNSWSFATFPIFENELKNKDYYWQGIAYLILAERKKYEVCYLLMNTPEELIEREINSHCYKNNLERSTEIDLHFHKLLTYDNVSSDLRVKSYTFELDNDIEDLINEKVLKARQYINELLKNIK